MFVIIAVPIGSTSPFKLKFSVKNGFTVDVVVLVNLAKNPFILSAPSTMVASSSSDSMFANKDGTLLENYAINLITVCNA